MLSQSGAIGAKAKAMYGKRIRNTQYEELIRKKSVSEIAQVLKNDTGFANTLKDIHEASIHRGQLEHLLRQDMYRRLDKLVRYVDGKQRAYFLAALKEIELEQLLTRIRIILSRDFTYALGDVPMNLKHYTKLNLDQLIQAKTFTELLEGLKGSEYEVILAPFAIEDMTHFDYTGCEMALYQHYIAHVMKTIDNTFKGKTKRTLKAMWATRIELDNITRIYRFKKFFHGDEEMIRSSLMECEGCIPKAMLSEMIQASSGESFLRLLAASPYHLHMDDKEYVYIEYYADQIRYHLAKRHMHYDNQAAIVYSAYQLLAEREIENLINIIEGVRYQVPSDEMKTMLIYEKE